MNSEKKIYILEEKKKLTERAGEIKLQIEESLKKSSRSLQDITILLASKKQAVFKLEHAFSLGFNIFGENYLNDLQTKKEALKDKPIDWHFIGKLQSNKIRDIAKTASLIHSLDQKKHIEVFKKTSSQTAHVLIQLNLSQEASKGGVTESELEEFINLIQETQNLKLKGLMTMPPMNEDSRPFFRKLRELSQKYKNTLSSSHSLDTLSMGTSHDFEKALEEGATLIRLGSAILGERK